VHEWIQRQLTQVNVWQPQGDTGAVVRQLIVWGAQIMCVDRVTYPDVHLVHYRFPELPG
jgi:hypothetical protein